MRCTVKLNVLRVALVLHMSNRTPIGTFLIINAYHHQYDTMQVEHHHIQSIQDCLCSRHCSRNWLLQHQSNEVDNLIFSSSSLNDIYPFQRNTINNGGVFAVALSVSASLIRTGILLSHSKRSISSSIDILLRKGNRPHSKTR